MSISLYRRIKAKILRRRVPFRYSWRFVSSNDAVSIHKKVMFYTLKNKPILGLLFLYYLVTWCVFWHWRSMYLAMNTFAANTRQKGVPIPQQVIHIIRGGIGQGISAFEYYQFALYERPLSTWWLYVFDFQLPYFHTTFQSSSISQSSQQFISNKAVFAERLDKAKGKPIATIDCVNLNVDWPINDWLAQSSRLFIKPLSGSRSIGCVSIFQGSQWTCCYLGDVYEGEEGLLKLKSLLPHGKYLVQPFLRNHPLLQKLQMTDSAMTIRIISCSNDGICEVIMANLEISNELNQRLTLFAINIENGQVELDDEFLKRAFCNTESGFTLPHWHGVVEAVQQAHALCRDIHTVGWDVVIEDNDVVLLEGNINWALNAMQITHSEPLLTILSKASNRYK